MRPLAFALTLLALGAGTAAEATAQQPPAAEIIESQRRLEQIRRERAQLREEMSRIRSRVSDLSSELGNVERQVSTSAELLGELESQLSQREEQIVANTVELEQTRVVLAERRDVLHRRLREIYKRGPLQTLQVLLAAESFSDLLNRYRYLLLIARHDRQLADEVAYLEGQLISRERALRSTAFQLESTRRDRAVEYEQLEQLREQQGLALTSVRNREQTTTERLAELARDESRVNELVASFEADRSAAAPGGSAGAGPGRPPAQALSPGAQGTLPWPVEGSVLYGFGTAPPGQGVAVRRSGLGIGAPLGAPVRSVAAGTVVLAGPFEGYGPTVVVSHGGGYYSLYLYLGQVTVANGSAIAAGQPLGSVGRPRAAEPPQLEFQMRTPGGEAVDPLAWLSAP